MTRSLMTGVAIAAMMTFSGAASAQTMIAGQTVSETDLPRVQSQCDALWQQAQTEARVSSTDSDSDGAGDENAPDNSGENTDSTADPAAQGATTADGTDEALTTIDLAALSLADCQEAGLVGM